MTQIISYSQLTKLRNSQLKQTQLVLITGVFDILHQAHTEFLHQAKLIPDVLVVGLEPDLRVKHLKGKNRPINNISQRMNNLKQLNIADYLFKLPPSIATSRGREVFIKKLKPNTLAVSSSTPNLKDKRRIMKLVKGVVKIVLYHKSNISTSNIVSSSLNS